MGGKLGVKKNGKISVFFDPGSPANGVVAGLRDSGELKFDERYEVKFLEYILKHPEVAKPFAQNLAA